MTEAQQETGNHMTDKRYVEIYNLLNRYKGDNIWQDIIVKLDGYDEDATAAADPSDQLDIVVLKDGTWRHDASAFPGTEWQVDQ